MMSAFSSSLSAAAYSSLRRWTSLMKSLIAAWLGLIPAGIASNAARSSLTEVLSFSKLKTLPSNWENLSIALSAVARRFSICFWMPLNFASALPRSSSDVASSIFALNSSAFAVSSANLDWRLPSFSAKPCAALSAGAITFEDSSLRARLMSSAPTAPSRKASFIFVPKFFDSASATAEVYSCMLAFIFASDAVSSAYDVRASSALICAFLVLSASSDTDWPSNFRAPISDNALFSVASLMAAAAALDAIAPICMSAVLMLDGSSFRAVDSLRSCESVSLTARLAVRRASESLVVSPPMRMVRPR